MEYPDYFESVLGGQSGIFILSLPREERPEIVEHVWYARHYDRQIQKVLSEVGVEELGRTVLLGRYLTRKVSMLAESRQKKDKFHDTEPTDIVHRLWTK